MNEIAAFITALGHATNVAKALIQTRDEANRSELAVEFNEALIDIQMKQLAVVEKNQSLLAANEALNKKLAEYDQWEKEKTKYVLRQLPSGGFIYALDPAQQPSEPPHWICAHCYQDHYKSILQTAGTETGERTHLWVCPKCKTKIIHHGDWPTTFKVHA